MLDLIKNPFYQVAGVAVVILLVVLLISVIKKRFTLNRIMVMIALVFVGVSSVLLNFAQQDKSLKPSYNQAVADRYFAAAYADAGDYETAYELLKTAATKDEQPGDILNLARISALRDNYLYAQLYYGKFLKDHPGDAQAVEEAGIVTGLYGTKYNVSNNGAIKKMLEAEGMSYEDAGFEQFEKVTYTKIDNVDEFKQGLLAKLLESSEAALKNVEEKSSIKKCAEYIITVSKAYQLYKMYMSYGSEELTEATSKLNRYLKNGGMLSQNATVRNAALIANTLADDADTIAKNIDEYATVDELAVAIELRVKSYVSDKAFKSVPNKPESQVLADVYKQCVQVKDSKTKTLTKEEEAYYKSVVSLIRDSNKNYVMKTLLSLLTAKSFEMDESIKSQMYMQLAKGYQFAEMDEQVSSYLDLALSNSSTASDKDYAHAMGIIIDYITGSSVSGRDLDFYIKDALNRVIPVPMELFSKPVIENATGFVKVDTEYTPDFETVIKNQATQKRAVINIGRVDISRFPTVSTKISFGESAGITLDNFKDNVTLSDCGFPITNYTVKERSGSTTRVILMCDNSGSMEYDVSNLKNAIRNFADGMSEGEEVAVVAFTDYITIQSGFLSEPEDVKAYADRMVANGGTNIYGLLSRVSALFGDSQSDNNVLIVMTDGQDNYYANDGELRRGISEIVGEYGCSIYTIGLGSADTDYLQRIANYGNGQCLTVSQSSDLDDFYAFIHSQVSNQYFITFDAQDQNLDSRKLEISLNNAIGKAEKRYSLSNNPDSTYDEYAQSKYNAKDPDGLQVYGFGNTYFYQSGLDTALTLYGENFKLGDKYRVQLTGNLHSYNLTYTVISATEMEVIIPSTVATGSYGIKVTSSAGIKAVSNALTVGTAPELSSFKFGDYIFTCEKITRSDSEVVLEDNVVLNGWLHFKGKITISGDYDGTRSPYAYMRDDSGSEISYSSNGTKGITYILASNGIPIVIPKLGSLKIYSAPYDSSDFDEFSADRILLNAAIPIKGLAYISGQISLYPDMIYTEALYTKLSLNFMDSLLKNLPNDIWNHEFKGSLALTNSQMCLSGSYELTYDKDNDTKKKFQLGTMGFSIKKFKVDLSSLTGKYGMEFEVGLSAFEVGSFKVSGFGLKLGWVDGLDSLAFDSFELSTSGSSKIKVVQTPIPMYLSGLSFGVSNMARTKDLRDILNWKVSGGFKLESDDIISKVPKSVKELFDLDELKLFEVPDAKITVCIAEFNINFSASLEFLGIPVGKCTINIGKFDYNSTVLNIQETEVGVSVQVTAGIQKTWDNLDIDVSGTVDLTLGYPASVLSVQGFMYYKLSWFIFSTSKDVYGDLGIGLLWNKNSEVQFIFKAYYQDKHGDYKGIRVDCSESMGRKKTKY